MLLLNYYLIEDTFHTAFLLINNKKMYGEKSSSAFFRSRSAFFGS